MPKFKVHVQQYVEELATVEVTASTAEAAAQKVRQQLSTGEIDLDWRDGDDSHPAEVYAVSDRDGLPLWER